jgi:hypothetical protein
VPKIAYVERKMRDDIPVVVAQANRIIAEYARQGYKLTLRQWYRWLGFCSSSWAASC